MVRFWGQKVGSTRIIITRIMEGQAMWTLRQISGWLKMLYVRVVEVTSGAVPGHAVSSNPQIEVCVGGWISQADQICFNYTKGNSHIEPVKTPGCTVAISRTNRSHSAGNANLHLVRVMDLTKQLGRTITRKGWFPQLEGLPQCHRKVNIYWILLCARIHSKHCIWINSFNPPQNTRMDVDTIAIPILQIRKIFWERLSNLSYVRSYN